MNTTIIMFEGREISHQAFCDRYEEYLLKSGMNGLDARNRSRDIGHFLESMEQTKRL